MRIHFNFLSQVVPTYLNESLFTQRQRILAIAVIALSCLAVLYLLHHFCFKAKKDAPLDELKPFFKISSPPPPSDKIIGKPQKGMNLEASCSNEACSTKGKINIFPVGNFVLGKLAADAHCPACKTGIRPNDVESVILDSCRFKVIGVQVTDQIENVFEALPGQTLRLQSLKSWYYLEFKLKSKFEAGWDIMLANFEVSV